MLHRPGTYALFTIALLGWAIAGLIAWVLVARLGWVGLILLGLATLLIAFRVDLDDENAVPDQYGTELYARQLARKPDLLERAARNRLLSLMKTVGIALAAIGVYMFVRQQL